MTQVHIVQLWSGRDTLTIGIYATRQLAERCRDMMRLRAEQLQFRPLAQLPIYKVETRDVEDTLPEWMRDPLAFHADLKEWNSEEEEEPTRAATGLPPRMSISVAHFCDAMCSPDRYGLCHGCGAVHGDPCPRCGGRAYHTFWCAEAQAAERRNAE